MIVCIAEKPSVAKDIADILGARSRREGYLEGSSLQWSIPLEKCTHRYDYTYNESNALSEAIYSITKQTGCRMNCANGSFNVQNITYDDTGNLTALQRYGATRLIRIWTTNGFSTRRYSYGLIDDLSLTYNGNQLDEITDDGLSSTYEGAFEYPGLNGGGSCGYDPNGNLTYDQGHDLQSISYNHLNLPRSIQMGTGNTAGTLYLAYDYAGNKVRSRSHTATQTTDQVTDYCGNLIYQGGTLRKILTEVGYVTLENSIPSHHLYVKDYLGNIRMVLAVSDSASVFDMMEQVKHYYPYGAPFPSLHTPVSESDQNRLYNGKELERTFGLDWYDFEARFADASLGRFNSLDLCCEKYYGISPYAFCANNPVNRIDLDGKDAILIVFPDYPINLSHRPEINNSSVGHAGILLINNKTGETAYYEYGRYKTFDNTSGRVRAVSTPKVDINSNGKPNIQSLNEVMKVLSKKAGKGGRIEGAYIISKKYAEMNSYATTKFKESNISQDNNLYNKNRKPYSLLKNNCGTFAADIIKQDKSVDCPWVVIPTPINIVDEYIENGNVQVTYNPETNITSIGKGD